jgi:hypothetical protein
MERDRQLLQNKLAADLVAHIQACIDKNYQTIQVFSRSQGLYGKLYI